MDKHNDNDRSPVFLQFVDCVWQVTNQFPHCFEFNEYFLTFVVDHLYSCLFGTFLCNSDKERRVSGVPQKTQSLWSFVNYRREMFLNPGYNAEESAGVGGAGGGGAAIFPEASVRYLKLWTGYYCRWNPRMRPQGAVRQRQTQLLAIKENLRHRVGVLRKELDGRRNNSAKNAKDGGVALDGGGGGGGSLAVGAGGVPTSAHPAAVMTKYESINI